MVTEHPNEMKIDFLLIRYEEQSIKLGLVSSLSCSNQSERSHTSENSVM